MKQKLKAFIDGITVLEKGIEDAKTVLKRLDELISWTRIKFKVVKCRSSAMVKEQEKETHFSIAGDKITIVKEQPVKSHARWYKDSVSEK